MFKLIYIITFINTCCSLAPSPPYGCNDVYNNTLFAMGNVVSKNNPDNECLCPGLKYLVIESSVTEIADYTFAFCNLETVYIYDGVEIIGRSAFRYNTQMRSINIPSSVKHIQDFALSQLFSLKTISLYTTGVIIDENVFYDTINNLDDCDADVNIIINDKHLCSLSPSPPPPPGSLFIIIGDQSIVVLIVIAVIVVLFIVITIYCIAIHTHIGIRIIREVFGGVIIINQPLVVNDDISKVHINVAKQNNNRFVEASRFMEPSRFNSY